MNCNKKAALSCFLLLFLSLTGFAQQIRVESESPAGRKFSKRVEYNFGSGGLNNFNSKTDIEKLFFGNFNATIEFFIETSSEHEEGPYGFRVFPDSLKTGYVIESKRINIMR
ncbi:hypothetical protein AGMMS50239_19200 [Bacteroidia bacterium]|nr:hypothetical protein AGMMS50239_19200 [Bacteroidia bacterium]